MKLQFNVTKPKLWNEDKLLISTKSKMMVQQYPQN